MEDKITYRYSWSYCLINYGLLAWALYLISSPFSKALSKNIVDELYYGTAVLTLITIFLYITIRYTIPMLRGKIAFEINQIGVVDHSQNFIIEWGDITDIKLSQGRSVTALYFYFKGPNGSHDRVWTRLNWVNGEAKEIYGIIEANLEDRKPNWHARQA
ncbi:hypothetical protein INP83_08650 [Mucilaginibacter sp. 21P]|uniref:hypothetical protein n=1 Tax=Mucilaginibacter sp. 21P TaxID=2778902 RepID=UPI001C573C9D|nr:hypothetical protein [Mucilaginibacter sp. 21P]QXV67136.1 hypothetical protein INP83_08650 [Mucilaginibacter sp. 21P]